MPLESTTKLTDSLITYKAQTVSCLVNRSVPFPRWIPPSTMTSGTFEKEAENRYRQEITKDKVQQDAERLINRGNDYYFTLIAKKAYNLLTRGRMTAVSANVSMDKGMSADNGFLKKKYTLVGDRAEANDIRS